MANSKHIGARFGKLTATGIAEVRRSGRHYVQIMSTVCDCGTTRQVHLTNLTSGGIKSCKTCAHPPRQHTSKHPLYSTWHGIRSRCDDPGNPAFKHYGGRGIKLCPRWRGAPQGFDNFVNDMGPRPGGMSLDRIDNNGDYEPSNCRWASPITQQNNKTNNVRVTLHGRTHTIAQWCRELNISTNRLALPRAMGIEDVEILHRISEAGGKSVKWKATRKPRDPSTYRRRSCSAALDADYAELHRLLKC